MVVDADVIPYLKTQFQQARPILLTGAGFSRSADCIEGGKVASVDDLRSRLWNLVFPDAPLDPAASLQSVFEAALLRAKPKIAPSLLPILSVRSDSLPSWYELYFSTPWWKIYTLNIDDLAQAAHRRFHLPRKLNPVSGIQSDTGNQRSESEFLNVIHLNGALENLPDAVTFSHTQYSSRLAGQEPVYVRLASELLNHPFIFVGTRLDESPLWQHIELRSQKGGKVRELRKKSFLVTPNLDKAKEASLGVFNIEWLKMGAEEFAHEVLARVADVFPEGHKSLQKGIRGYRSKEPEILNVGSHKIDSSIKTDFLIGAEPTWVDIQRGHAIERSIDKDIWSAVQEIMTKRPRERVLCLSGTSGCGKSTSLMRLALRLSASGAQVGWIDNSTEFSGREIVRAATEVQKLDLVAIDDADFLGGELSAIVTELTSNNVVAAVAIRSSRVERTLIPSVLGKLTLTKYYLEELSDPDIEDLLEVLERENRLGSYRGLMRGDQIKAFRADTGRQLLVGMIKATLGEKLEQKVPHEYEQLNPLSKLVYGAICVANTLDNYLDKSDVLIATGHKHNESLLAIESLLGGRLIFRKDGSTDIYRSRHRMVSELVFKHIQKNGELRAILTGIAVAMASKTRAGAPNRSRTRRLLTRITSHDFLIRVFGTQDARALYADLETPLSSDHHYWLQRGCFELEYDNIRLAENFLSQANAINRDDPFVQTSWAHLLFKKALHSPRAKEAGDWVSEAERILEWIAKTYAHHAPKAIHIRCSQGLSWARHGLQSFEEKRDYLKKLLVLAQGAAGYASPDVAMATLRDDIKHDLYSLALKR